MDRCTSIGLAAALALAIVIAPRLASAEQAALAPPVPPTIAVDGSASAAVAPDTAILSVGVVTTRPKATDAVNDNSKALAAALAAIQAEGIPADAITTTAVELSAVTDEPKTGTPKVVGYRARNQLEIRVRPVADVGKLTATLIDKGVNAIDDLSFANSDEETLRDRLRSEAAKNARRKAEIYTSALGLRLGRVLEMRPDAAPGTFGTVAAPAPMARAATVPVPVEAGQRSLTEHVSVTFELVQ